MVAALQGAQRNCRELVGAGASNPQIPLSDTSMPASPVDVKMAIRRPRRTRLVASAAKMSRRSPKVWARITPVWRNRSSYMRFVPAIAPVYETATLAPTSEPDLEGNGGLACHRHPERGGPEFLGTPDRFDVSAMTRVTGSASQRVQRD